MFDKINSSILNEGDYDLVDTGRVTYDDTKQKDSDNESKKEETKKNIFEKLKELFIKAVKFVTSIFQKFVDWVHNIYMNSNIKDSIGQAIGKHIEYKNLTALINSSFNFSNIFFLVSSFLDSLSLSFCFVSSYVTLPVSTRS
jgi:hypothetical protein